jgi:hypothetical protein
VGIPSAAISASALASARFLLSEASDDELEVTFSSYNSKPKQGEKKDEAAAFQNPDEKVTSSSSSDASDMFSPAFSGISSSSTSPSSPGVGIPSVEVTFSSYNSKPKQGEKKDDAAAFQNPDYFMGYSGMPRRHLSSLLAWAWSCRMRK